jgi:hypothetical protein
MVVVNEKGEGPFVRADVDEIFAVRCQFPHQCEGRALGKRKTAQIRTKSKIGDDDILLLRQANCAPG